MTARKYRDNRIKGEKAKLITQFQKELGIPSSWLREVAETRAAIKEHSPGARKSLTFMKELKSTAFDLMEVFS